MLVSSFYVVRVKSGVYMSMYISNDVRRRELTRQVIYSVRSSACLKLLNCVRLYNLCDAAAFVTSNALCVGAYVFIKENVRVL